MLENGMQKSEENSNTGSLVCVIPSVAQFSDDNINLDVDIDFANNLEAYLSAFDSVTVLCPAARGGNLHARVRPLSTVVGYERLEFIILPEPYREDRYVKNFLRVRRILTEVLNKNKFRLISPHAPLDWSTLAANICIEQNLRYNMEADWNLPQVLKFLLSDIRNPVNRIRKSILVHYHARVYWNCLRRSSLSLVKAGDVYNAYKGIAPNAFPVMNVQLGPNDHISQIELEKKILRLGAGNAIDIVYSGRAISIKGPLIWLELISRLKQAGLKFRARWFGDGSELEAMKNMVADRGLGDVCFLQGQVNREVIFEQVRAADLFVFCHMTQESPRCLAEALANGTPIVGFESDYARVLVEKHGGGRFVEIGDVDGLSRIVADLAAHPDQLGNLMRDASASGRLLDRANAISERIGLMKTHLG